MSTLKKLRSLPWTTIMSGLSTFVFRLAILALFLVLAIVIVRGLNSDGYSVQAFQVPKELNDAGYNGQVVALLIQDQVKNLKVLANSVREDSLNLNVNLRPDLNLDVMGVGLSTSSMIFHLKELLGRENYTIGGNITDMDYELKLNIRMSGYESLSIMEAYEEDGRQEALTELIDQAALYVLKNTDPYRLAVVHYRRDEIEKSEDLVRYMIVDRPNDRKWAYHFWGNIKSQKGDRKGSEELYLKAIEEDASFVMSRRALGWSYFEERKYAEALEQFERCLEIDFKSTSAYNGAALCHRLLGDLDKSKEYYERQLEVFPSNIWSYGNYSDFLMRFGKDTIRATQLWKEASENIEISGDYYAAISSFHLMKKDSAMALTYAYQALDLDPGNVGVLQGLSSFSYYKGDYAQAEIYYKDLLTSIDNGGFDDGMKINAYNMLAMSEYHQMKYDSAIVHVQRAIDIAPQVGYPYSTLAEIHLLKNDVSKFYPTIEKAISRGFRMEEFLEDHPYNLIKDKSRLLALIDKYKVKNEVKG